MTEADARAALVEALQTFAALGIESGDENAGLSLARQLAILSYRTPEEFAAHIRAETDGWHKLNEKLGIKLEP